MSVSVQAGIMGFVQTAHPRLCPAGSAAPIKSAVVCSKFKTVKRKVKFRPRKVRGLWLVLVQ